MKASSGPRKPATTGSSAAAVAAGPPVDASAAAAACRCPRCASATGSSAAIARRRSAAPFDPANHMHVLCKRGVTGVFTLRRQPILGRSSSRQDGNVAATPERKGQSTLRAQASTEGKAAAPARARQLGTSFASSCRTGGVRCASTATMVDCAVLGTPSRQCCASCTATVSSALRTQQIKPRACSGAGCHGRWRSQVDVRLCDLVRGISTVSIRTISMSSVCASHSIHLKQQQKTHPS